VTRSTVTCELTDVFGQRFRLHPLFDTFLNIGLFLPRSETGRTWHNLSAVGPRSRRVAGAALR